MENLEILADTTTHHYPRDRQKRIPDGARERIPDAHRKRTVIPAKAGIY